MTGARFVHDQLELAGWDVLIADAQRVRGLAPLAAKADKIDAHVLAELTRRALVPEIWLPTPGVREERERARFRLHLVRHRSALKNRIHATLMALGHPVPMTDLFGVAGRQLLDRLDLPEPWKANLVACLALVDDLTGRVDAIEVELRHLGADHASIPLLLTVPGVGPILAYTIASEIGDVRRFASPKKLAGYTGLCPIVRQSGGKDRRGPLAKNGPKYLRWALIEAATHAARDAHYRERYERTCSHRGSAECHARLHSLVQEMAGADRPDCVRPGLPRGVRRRPSDNIRVVGSREGHLGVGKPDGDACPRSHGVADLGG